MKDDLGEDTMEFNVHNITQALQKVAENPKEVKKTSRAPKKPPTPSSLAKRVKSKERTRKDSKKPKYTYKTSKKGKGVKKATTKEGKKVGDQVADEDAIDVGDFVDKIPSHVDGIQLTFPTRSPVSKLLTNEERQRLKQMFQKEFSK